MPKETVKALVDQADYAKHIFPQFWGEPSLHPDFEEILEYMKSKNKVVSYYTNATLFHKKDIKTILLNTDLIHISIDSINAEHFKETCRSNCFSQLKENIINTWNANQILGSPCKIIIRATELMGRGTSYRDQFEAAWSKFCHGIKWRPLRNLDKHYALSTDLNLDYCPRLSDHCIIKADGRMVLCCTDHFGDNNIGNVTNKSILEIFNSRTFQKYRNSIDKLDLCKNCWYQYQYND